MIRVLTRGSAAVLVLGSVACSDISGVGNDATNLSSSEVQNLALGVSALATTSADDRAWEGAAFSVSTLDIDAALHRGGRGGGGTNGGAKAGPGVGGALFGGIWGPRGLGRHGTTTTTIERSGPCPRGGTLESVTTISAVVDSVAQTGTVTTESIDTPDACAFGVRNRNTVLLSIAEAGT